MAMDELWQANTFQQARAAACSGHRAAPSRRGQPPQGGRASQPGQLHRDLHFLQRAYLRREVHLLLRPLVLWRVASTVGTIRDPVQAVVPVVLQGQLDLFPALHVGLDEPEDQVDIAPRYGSVFATARVLSGVERVAEVL